MHTNRSSSQCVESGWTSADTTVAVVNNNGLVTALAAGTSTITAKTIAGNYTATSAVTVSGTATGVTASGVNISPSRLSLTTGQTGQLTGIIAPSNATDQAVTWTSGNTAVATVSGTGVVTAVSTGTATITATSADGGFTSQATTSVNAGVTSYSTRLSAMPNERYGLAKSLSVMPGDTIKMEVYAKYVDNNTNNWNAALTNLMTAIAQGTAPSGTFVDGGAAGSIGGTTFPYVGTLPRTGDTGTGPKAYLNYIVFDKNFVFKTGGFKRISETPKEDGTDVPHERLAFDGAEQVVITEPGYVYIYLSNENDTPVEVYFDDFKVDHIKGPIVASQDYYPFGLTLYGASPITAYFGMGNLNSTQPSLEKFCCEMAPAFPGSCLTKFLKGLTSYCQVCNMYPLNVRLRIYAYNFNQQD